VTAQNEPAGDLTGRVYVVTGASSGIGLAAAEALARRGGQLVLVGRDPVRLRAAEARVREIAAVAPLAIRADFGRFDDVRRLAGQIRDRFASVDALANNAGGLVPRRTLTDDGYEATIQANHLSPFLLTFLLREQLRGGRVVNTASNAHRWDGLNPDDLHAARTRFYSGWRAYGASKQASILFTVEAIQRWPDVLSTCYHPGVVRTGFGAGTIATLFFRTAPFLTTPVQGADTLVWLATVPAQQLTPGAYYYRRRRRKPAAYATNPALAARLWDASLAAVGPV
jgi:daunorubicin C-13 ketoreductase